MKKLLLFSFFIFSFSFTKAQWVTIPDVNFVAWLNYIPNGFAICMNGNQMDTTSNVVVHPAMISVGNNNISDLTGIQYFDSLITLGCTYNQITTIPPLANTLKTLTCDHNQISSLPILPNSIRRLYCNNNLLTSLPALPDSLRQFNCAYNLLTQLPSLPNLISLFHCDENQLTSLPPLPDSLYYLFCANNLIDSLPVLPDTLAWLDCASNSLSTLPILPNSLLSLSFSYNQVTSLTSLPNSLAILGCANNPLGNLCALPASVTELECEGDQLNSLPDLPNSLYYLYCGFNQLTQLPILPSSLTDLDCRSNQLSEIPNLPTSLYHFCIQDNPNILCMPPLEVFNGTNPYYDFTISNTGIVCLPNVIQHTGYIPAIDTMPVCDLFNQNSCGIGWNIKGIVVFDLDHLCATQNDGVGLSMLKVNLYDSGNNLLQQFISNWNGDYSFDTQLGNYFNSVDTVDLPFKVFCPGSNNIASNLTPVDSTHYNVNFRLKCKPGFDIGAWNIYSWFNFFPGNIIPVHIVAGDYSDYLSNGFCSSGISGEVKVVINGPANYVSPLAGALTPTVNGDTLTYSIADFSLLNAQTDFAFNVLTDSTALLGEQICFDVFVTPTSGDNNVSNNTLTHCFEVVNSYDPNEKEVSPIGSLGFPYNDWLTYTIHFQNTGTAPAQHIQILDTLDADLDASTFQLLSYSHAPMVQLFGSNVKFNFPNINLPDSTTDFEGSKGYVSYRVKPLANLPLGTTIENTASIYFDFNTPVVTNTVSNLICNPIAPTNLSQTICAGDSYNFNGNNLSTTGNYSVTLNAINGCDSVVNLNLTVLNPASSSLNQNICSGDVFNFNGVNLSTTGIYYDTLNAINGCDSLVNLNLTVLNPVSSSLNHNICIGDIYNFNGVNLSSSGIYFDTLTSVSTCDSIITLNLTVENINATIQQSNDTLTATGNGTVQWYNCNTQQIITGATQTIFVPTSSGIYAAIITSSNCVDTSACVQVYTGVNELQIADYTFQIYPNPTNDEVSISLLQPCSDCTIEITNTLGQQLISKSINDKSESINLGALPSGIYFVALRSDKFTSVKKLVKE